MMRSRSWFAAAATFFASITANPVSAQASSYTYVKMSLGVPWTLYFVFLAGVLIPFVVMIVLAWRGAAHPKPDPMGTTTDAPAGEAGKGAP